MIQVCSNSNYPGVLMWRVARRQGWAGGRSQTARAYEAPRTLSLTQTRTLSLSLSLSLSHTHTLPAVAGLGVWTLADGARRGVQYTLLMAQSYGVQARFPIAV